MLPTVLGVHNRHRVVGGSERYFLELGRLLASKGHRVVHLSTAHPENEPPPGPAVFLPPVDLVQPGPADLARFHYSLRAARAVRTSLRSERIDLAHLHIYYGHITASILAPLRRAGIPVVQTLHEYKLICPVHSLVSRGRLCEACRGRHFWRALPRRCNRGSLARTLVSVSESYLSRWLGAGRAVDHFLAPSDFLRRKVIEHGLDEGRVTTLPNFVDAAALRPGNRPGRHFLFFGRLERVKGIFTLLEASAATPDVPLVLAGEGEARLDVEAFIRARRLEHVRLVGFRSGRELEELIRESLCVVQPSQCYENCPLSVLEAMAFARPVVGSRIGGIPELVKDGASGLLFEPGSAAELAERLRWMADHREAARELGAVARARALSEFGPDAHYERLMAVYRRVQ